MSTDQFRQTLRNEIKEWQQEGLISSEVYEHLWKRYQLDQVDSGSNNRFVSVLLGLGGILLGLGIITLVAANWQVWSRLLRTIVIYSAFLSVNTAGFYIWQRSEQRLGTSRLGNGLLLTGALLMGANIGLLSQMFHQSGSVNGLYLVWGLGVLAMAYSLRLTSLGVLSWVLVLMSYWGTGFGGSWQGEGINVAWIAWIVEYLPILITPLFLPLAHWCRSRVLYGAWGIGLIILLPSEVVIGPIPPLMQVAFLAVLPAVLWVHRAQVKVPRQRWHKQSQTDLFEPVGRSLAIWFISFVTYVLSFSGVWTSSGNFYSEGSLEDGYLFILWLLGLGALFAYGVWQLKRLPARSQPRSLWMRSPTFSLVLLLLSAAVWINLKGFLWQSSSSLTLCVIALNMVLFFIGFAMLHDGTVLGIRRRFWGGMGIVVIGLITRMFEYNTDLLFKAAVLALCGIGIIAAGLWFEKTARRAANLAPENLSSTPPA